jgi:hypothetical protein
MKAAVRKSAEFLSAKLDEENKNTINERMGTE